MSAQNFYIMQSAVEPMQSELPCYTPLTNHATHVHVVPLVMASDYARLEQECDAVKAASLMLGRDLAATLKLLARCQENLHPHRDAALWSDVCAALGPKP